MKPIQWIVALVVLVGMVFLITFAMNFLGTSKPNDEPQGSGGDGQTVLQFLTTTYPAQEKNMPIVKFVDMEMKADGGRNPGYRDYLFVNPTNEEVTVGRTGKVCTCSGVELYLAPDEWKDAAARLLASEAAAGAFQAAEGVGGAPHPLFNLGSLAMLDRDLHESAEKVKPAAGLNVKDHQPETATIPPHAVGWFRMRWNADKVGDKLINAELLSRAGKANGIIKLEAHIRFVEPVQYPAKEIPLPDLSLDKLEKGPADKPRTLYVANLVIWSTTRKSLHPKVKVLSKLEPAQNPVQLDDTVAIPREQLNRRSPGPPGQPPPEPWQVACAYRIPVRLMDRSPDGSRPMPFGSFRARVRVSFDDEDVEPVLFVIGGRLRGDIRVGGGDEGRLSFGTFYAAEGSQSQSVTLFSDVPGLKLEVDEKLTPAFLREAVDPKEGISKPTKTIAGETAWTLTAQVGKNKAQGSFPRDDEEYWDSAIYLKVTGDDKTRTLRVPVDGSANDR
jgi:hypothetical protein